MKQLLAFIALTTLLISHATASPVPVIFDTDIGNDIDDVLALSMLHAFQARGECQLLGVTITKADDLAGPFVDAVNHFYGHVIPIGCARPATNEPASKFLSLANTRDHGNLRYPHKLQRGTDALNAVVLLRKLLSQADDHSVVIVQVGYFSNLGALLDVPGGRELIAQKVRLLSVMAGAFRESEQRSHFTEFNVVKDIPAARKVAADWPTPIVWSGFEIGAAIPYPAISIQSDYNYVSHHPVAEAYCLFNPPPHERPCWDLTSVLYAIRPERGYFDLSSTGHVTVEPDGFTLFTPAAQGRDRYLILKPDQIARAKEALVELASQPPQRLAK